jgi:hypothetical protein
MSKMGVPSRRSNADSNTFLPSILSTLAKVIPIALGRCGVRVANTPTDLPFNLGGLILDRKLWLPPWL